MIIISPITHHPAVAVSWCSADASAGSSWISPGAQSWVVIQLQIPMKLVQTELDSMSQASRKGTGGTQHPISSVFIARLGQLHGKRPSKIQVCWEEPQTHGALSALVLLSSGFLQAEKAEVSQKGVFSSSASSAQCAAKQSPDGWMVSKCHLLVSKAHFEMPVPRSTDTSAGRKSPGSFSLMDVYYSACPR